MTVKLYVEGGGDSDALRRKCREGFNGFLKNAGFKGRMPRLVACGGRQQALDRFASACKAGETCMILIDSETPVSAGTSP